MIMMCTLPDTALRHQSATGQKGLSDKASHDPSDAALEGRISNHKPEPDKCEWPRTPSHALGHIHQSLPRKPE